MIKETNKTTSVKLTDETTININLYPTLDEKCAFIRKTVNDSFIDDIDVYFVRVKAIFDVLYLIMFTDYQFPDSTKNSEGQIRIEDAYDHLREYDIDSKLKTCPSQVESIRTELWKDIKQFIEFEKAKKLALLSRNIETEKTLDHLNGLISMGVSFIMSATEKLDNISPDVLNKFLGNFNIEKLIKLIGDNNANAV